MRLHHRRVAERIGLSHRSTAKACPEGLGELPAVRERAGTRKVRPLRRFSGATGCMLAALSFEARISGAYAAKIKQVSNVEH
jgi:hypothetical protein